MPNNRTKANIIRRTLIQAHSPNTPTAIQALNEIQLIITCLSYTPLIGQSTIPSEVIEAYEALRRIDKSRYPEIDFKKAADELGLTLEGDDQGRPYYWERPENQGDPAGTV